MIKKTKILVCILCLLVLSLPAGSLALNSTPVLPGATVLITRSLVGAEPNGSSERPRLSANGRYVAFLSSASDLHSGDVDDNLDVYRYDRHAGLLELVSVASDGVKGNDMSGGVDMSADGRYIVFESLATNLISGETSPAYQSNVYLRDMQSGATLRLSRGYDGSETDGDSAFPSISPDGLYISFASRATNLIPGDVNNSCDLNGYPGGDWNCWDVFLYSRMSGTLELVSLADGPAGGQGNGASMQSDVSNGGSFIAFTSRSTNFIPGDSSGGA